MDRQTDDCGDESRVYTSYDLEVGRVVRENEKLEKQLAEARGKAGDCVSRKHYDEVNEATEAQISRFVQETSSLKTRLFYADRFAERLKGYLKAVTQERNEARKAYCEATKGIDPVALTASARRIKGLEEQLDVATQMYSDRAKEVRLLRRQVANLTEDRNRLERKLVCVREERDAVRRGKPLDGKTWTDIRTQLGQVCEEKRRLEKEIEGHMRYWADLEESLRQKCLRIETLTSLVGRYRALFIYLGFGVNLNPLLTDDDFLRRLEERSRADDELNEEEDFCF